LDQFNEYSTLKVIAIRNVENAFVNTNRLEQQWQALRFHSKPSFQDAMNEYANLISLFESAGIKLNHLGGSEALTLDSIYTRDALIISPKGIILCRMGRSGRQSEPEINSRMLGLKIHGEIVAPGTLEGGDFIWLDKHNAAVGLGPRTNQSGIDQLKALLGPKVELHVVPLPAPDHPDDVFHLMSMISPLDSDLALIYRPLMPSAFLKWLKTLGLKFVEVAESEFLDMACNVLAIGPRRIIMLDKLPLTCKRLEDAGCEMLLYKGDEISRKGEGGPTCLTRPLLREE